MSSLAQSSSQYIFQVHPSNKSQTAFKITRKPISRPQTNNHRLQQQNPYVYKPKSYSKKRIFSQSTSNSHSLSQANKKVKINQSSEFNHPSLNHLDFNFINEFIQQPLNNFFQESFLNQYIGINEQSFFKLPLDLEKSFCKENKQLSHKIEIVSTDNNKLLIPIHESILKANSNHIKQEQSLDGVVNPVNTQLKKMFSEKISFIRDYKSGYIPIQLQNKSKKQDQQGGYEQNKKNNSKSHFIKKKQSTLSLPRTCGVSYIKPSESVQGHPFEPLPPLIFQCSTSCKYTQEMKDNYGQKINRLINLCESRWLPVIITNEDNMRNLLLGQPKGKVLWVNGLMNVWPLFTQGIFIMVLIQDQLAMTQQQVWKQFKTCHFKFGILAKKSTSGKKLFLKSIQAQDFDQSDSISLLSLKSSPTKEIIQPENQHKKEQVQLNQEQQRSIPISMTFNQTIQAQQKRMQDSPQQQKKQCKDVFQQFAKQLKDCRTVITMALKFQMYLEQQQWKCLNNQQKNILNAIIHVYQQNLQKKALQVIRDRLQISTPHKREEYFIKCIPYLRIGNSIGSFKPINQTKIIQPFTLSTLKDLISSLQNRNLDMLPGRQITRNQFYKDKQGKENILNWQKYLKLPIYYISTRDSFAFDLIQNITLLKRGNRTYKKIVYHFESNNLPQNFSQYKKLFPDLRVGVTSYHDFYTEDQLKLFQSKTLETQRNAFKSKFLQMTVQPTIIGNRIKRSKFFFGYRYMWTRCQLAEPNSYVGAGVRRDVTPAPKWLQNVQNPLVQSNIVEPNFLNSVAINVYHDGTEGLAQHFDDAVRFKQPIFTLRLVSDGRLSFGSQFYGFCNGAFIIPLPRGCICVLQQNSYAANGVKHCIRPCDMAGKSAAIILRQMHHQVVNQATKYDQLIDFPSWLSTLSEDSQAVTYAEQKRRESEYILSNDDVKKEKQKARLLSQLL